jgi:hypothetical protein
MSSGLASNENELKDDSFWCWIFLLPAFLNILMVAIFILFIREDSIMINISRGQDQSALNLINTIYDCYEENP